MGSIRRTHRYLLLLLLIASISGTAFPQAALFTGVYHEAGCPSVDTTRMVRMKRHTAEAQGLLPAIDCHPDARIRYLGVGPAGPAPSMIEEESRPRTIHVRRYTRKDGTEVDEHFRAARSGKSDGANSGPAASQDRAIAGPNLIKLPNYAQGFERHHR